MSAISKTFQLAVGVPNIHSLIRAAMTERPMCLATGQDHRAVIDFEN